jgi:hypothetical protein
LDPRLVRGNLPLRPAGDTDEGGMMSLRNARLTLEDVVSQMERARAGLAERYNALPSDDIYLVSALTGQAKRNWYRNAREALQNNFGDDAELVADIIASLSPQQSVRLNLIMALSIYGDWLASGRALDNKTLAKLARKADLNCRKENLKRALHREALSGYKVKNFASNLKGDYNVATIDTWMMQFGDCKEASGYQKLLHLAYNAKIRHIAGLMGWEPAETQASIWAFIYSKMNKVNVEAVPEFAELLENDDDIRTALEAVRIPELAGV